MTRTTAALLAIFAVASACGRVRDRRPPPNATAPRSATRPTASLLFLGDYESGEIWTTDWRLRLFGGTAAIVTEPARAGRFACRFTLEPDQERAELQPLLPKHPIGGERWYGFSLFVPADWEPLARNEVVAQWKHTNDEHLGEIEGSPPLALRIEGNDWRINCRWDSRPASDKTRPEGKSEIARAPLDRGRWTDWVVRYRASFGSDGLVEIWKDGTSLARREGPNAYNDEQGLYFKWGIYHTDGRRVLVNDELRIGDEMASYEAVAPPVTGR